MGLTTEELGLTLCHIILAHNTRDGKLLFVSIEHNGYNDNTIFTFPIMYK